MTRQQLERQLAEHHAGFATRDAKRLAAVHAPHGTFASPSHGVVHGRAAIQEVYEYWYTAFPDFLLSWESAIIDPPRAAVFWAFEGTAARHFFGDVRHGSRVKMAGAAEYEFGDEGILAVRHVFDFSAVLINTGVLKIKPAS